MGTSEAVAAERLLGGVHAGDDLRGCARWYLVHVPEGREASTCEKVRGTVSPELIDDAFVMRKERWFKRGGIWRLESAPMYKGYFVAVSRDGRALARSISRLSFPAEVAGGRSLRPTPLSSEAQAWFEAALDGERVLRNSTAVIAGGQLRVQSGPLVGQEARVSKVDRHKRRCAVRVGDGGRGFTELVPLDVPFKS
ncbi:MULTISPECIES: hypothetical protein [unclassified Adlercreutzia]|uniref:hypothetical protein n=1 Tax=unclassified Adlercreutzia TaxID=2636013 RepID=UPI0013EC2456|nr:MULTISPECIES: hypothetical protein [unclassified Adlercreutzia]